MASAPIECAASFGHAQSPLIPEAGGTLWVAGRFNHGLFVGCCIAWNVTSQIAKIATHTDAQHHPFLCRKPESCPLQTTLIPNFAPRSGKVEPLGLIRT